MLVQRFRSCPFLFPSNRGRFLGPNGTGIRSILTYLYMLRTSYFWQTGKMGRAAITAKGYQTRRGLSPLSPPSVPCAVALTLTHQKLCCWAKVDADWPKLPPDEPRILPRLTSTSPYPHIPPPPQMFFFLSTLLFSSYAFVAPHHSLVCQAHLVNCRRQSHATTKQDLSHSQRD